MVPIVDRVGAPLYIRYKDDIVRLARVRLMKGLAAKAKLRTSDVNAPNWNVYDQYYRGEQR